MLSQKYKIISLGSHCFIRKILTEKGIKPSKGEGELSYPFDLCATPTNSLIEILENNFSDYFNNLYYDDKAFMCKNSKYNISYSHDTDCDTEKLKERYSKRIENFKRTLNDERFIYFVINNTTIFTQEQIKRIAKHLSKLRKEKPFKLIVLDFFNSCLEEIENVEYIKIKPPYDNYSVSWWNDKYRYTDEAKLFEQTVVNKISDIISKRHTVETFKGIAEDGYRKKQILVNFVDFPLPFMNSRKFSPYSNIFTDILEKHYKVIISDKPDFLFYNVFGNKHEQYENCVKIFFTCEVVAPNFNDCDYAIAFDDIKFGDRYLRYPLFYDDLSPKIMNKEHITPDMAKRKFCNFIYSNDSNGEGAVIRKQFCQDLSKYKKVDCPGKVLNNMQNAINSRVGNFAQGKLDFQKDYKFTIAFENNLYEGYTTEKLSQAFVANTIPIYWGNPDVVKEFNPKAFINCNDYDNLDDVIKKVIELDNNDEEYLKMLKEPCMQPDYDFDKKKKLEDFLINIMEKGNKPFNKNPNPVINKYGYVEALATNFDKSQKKDKRLFGVTCKYTNTEKKRKRVTLYFFGIKIKFRV